VATDIVATARELLDALGSNTGSDGRSDLLIRALGESLGQAPPEDARVAMATLASGVYSLDPAPAGIASRVVGAMIEAGHDPQPARAAMLAQAGSVCCSAPSAGRRRSTRSPRGIRRRPR